jgi:hypothetical protein
MSKVDAYLCDFKGHLVQAPGVVGIIPTEDLFDREKSYPTDFKPERCNIHYCTDCYKEQVLSVASLHVDRRGRKKGVDTGPAEREYELKVKELAFSFRELTVRKWRSRKKG